VKFIKKLLQRFKSSKTRKSVRPAPKPKSSPSGAQGPKNGRLTLAVIASVALMILLGVLNIKLIRNPSVASNFWPTLQSDDKKDIRPGAAASLKPANKNQKPVEPDFYVSLTTPDEQAPMTKAEPGPEFPAKTPDQSSQPLAKPGEKKEDRSKRGGLNPKHIQESSDVPLPHGDSNTKIYTVQVGAFEQPAIANEWAQKWKARGYEVTLKMTPRPKTATIYYQLQLGKFKSEQQADELVKHLKTKEGITAMRLVVRD
jgi:cell division septation protein DedD